MAFIKGYFFLTKIAIDAAIDAINDGEGIPKTPNAITKTYCTPMQCVGGWYIPFDQVTNKYLSNPIDIELPEQVSMQ